MFLFKKVVALLVSPFPVCMELLLAGLVLLWFTRRQKAGKVLVTLGTLALYVFGTRFLPEQLIRPLEQRYHPIFVRVGTTGRNAADGIPGVKYVVVLAGGYYFDPQMPATAELGDTLARVIEGVRVYRECPKCKLIMSGGGPAHWPPSAEVMAQAAESVGVSRQDLLLETGSRDTETEAQLVSPMVGTDAFILVTEASHMPRAVALFRKLGMNPIPDPTNYLAWHTGATPFDYVPNLGGMAAAHRAVYEYLGLSWEWLRGRI